MIIQTESILKTNSSTLSELYIDGVYMCETLEDTVRPLLSVCPNTPKGVTCNCPEKVYGKTAIPEGTYKVKLTYSNRFRKILPELLDVPHFLGIRIHSGNKPEDTEGCILVGKWDGKTPNWIGESRIYYNKLYALLKKASDNKEEITINIKR